MSIRFRNLRGRLGRKSRQSYSDGGVNTSGTPALGRGCPHFGAQRACRSWMATRADSKAILLLHKVGEGTSGRNEAEVERLH